MRPIDQTSTVTIDTPVKEVLETMGREDLNQLPVVSDGRLEGVYSLAVRFCDICKLEWSSRVRGPRNPQARAENRGGPRFCEDAARKSCRWPKQEQVLCGS